MLILLYAAFSQAMLFAGLGASPLPPPLRQADTADASYDYHGQPDLDIYQFVDTGAMQHPVTDELDQVYYGVRRRPVKIADFHGAKLYALDTSEVIPGKVTVHLPHGGIAEADFPKGASGSKIVPGSVRDSHGNRPPLGIDDFAGTNGRDYDFSGPGDPDDQRHFEQFIERWGRWGQAAGVPIELRGHGPHVHCGGSQQQGIVCRASLRHRTGRSPRSVRA